MQIRLTAIALALAIVIASSGAAARPVVKHQLSEVDEQQIDAMSNQFFSRLRSSSPESAVTGFLGNTELMEGKKAELAQLAGQIVTGLNIYGAISECILVQSKGRGGVAEERQFICQHDKLATRWKLLFIKTTKGWIAGNLYFDDKVMSDD
jgi:hypothetical protein